MRLGFLNRHSATRGASVYLREGLWLIHSQAETEAGFSISTPPYLAIPEHAANAALGRAVRQALDASESGVPTPDPDDEGSSRQLLELVGVRGWRKFARTASLIGVHEERGRIVLEPWRLKGPPGNPSFEPLPDHDLELDDVTPEALGRSLRRLSKLRELESAAG